MPGMWEWLIILLVLLLVAAPALAVLVTLRLVQRRNEQGASQPSVRGRGGGGKAARPSRPTPPASTPPLNEEQESHWQRVKELNRTWVEGRPSEVEAFFHPNAVTVFSGLSRRAEGRQACAESYAQFCQKATVDRFDQTHPMVDIFGDTVTVAYRYVVHYRMHAMDEAHWDEGHDLFVFVREGGRWLAAWRAVTLDDQERETDR